MLSKHYSQKLIPKKQHKLKTYFACNHQSFLKIMQKMCQKLTCMFSNWLKIRPYWFMHEIVLYSSDLVVQFKSNFDLPILIFSKIILFLFYREIFQSFLLVQSTLGFDEFFLYPWISGIRMYGNDFVICYQRIICLHALMGCASWAICRHSGKYIFN